MLSSSQRRISDSLVSLSDAETVEFLSQDSGSTVPSTPSFHDNPSNPASQHYNEPEEQLRRRAGHISATVPELTPAQNWFESNKEWSETRVREVDHGPRSCSSNTAVSASAWAATHPENITIFVRWRLLAHDVLPERENESISPWVPYTVPLTAVFPAVGSGPVTDTHTANALTKDSSGLDSTATHEQHTQSSGSAQLLLGRSMLISSVLRTTTAEMNTSEGESDNIERETLREAATSVSRVHCNVHLHFTAKCSRGSAPKSDLNNDNINSVSVLLPQCHSFDVFALSPATVLNGVPLHPHYRYHFQTDDASCCPSGVLRLKLGPYCSVDLALRGTPPLPQCETPAVEWGLSGGLALHRLAQRPLLNSVFTTTTTTAALTRDRHAEGLAQGSTTSLFTADSTAVLATLSNLSDSVALSETGNDAVCAGAIDVMQSLLPAESKYVETAALLDEVEENEVPKLMQRRSVTTKTANKSTTALNTKATATRRPNRRQTVLRREKEGEEDVAEDEVMVPAVPAPSGTVLFTTGVRLSDKEEDDLKALGALVNPHLRFARYAKVLVAQKPLMRSVKLLTVLPYVQEVVQQGWLDTVLHTHSLDIPVDSFRYSERRLPTSIESLNNFDLRETLQKPLENRQTLFAGQRFWVHKTAQPQDPPINDLKTVLTASGGVVTRRASDANVLVMPQQRPLLKCWKTLVDELGGLPALTQRKQAGMLLVVPDDVFKCVLQQRPLTHSTVAIPRTQLSSINGSSADNISCTGRGTTACKNKNNDNRGSSGGRCSSRGARKTQRSSTSQQSPRPTTQRRSL